MRPRRTPATLADYLVVAICPTLIGLLVGSLMWFLVEVFYQGEDKFRIFWVMSFFVLGVVSLARLSMEQGWGRASLFVLPLAGAVALLTPPVTWPLLVLVWWAAHQLTWDSTLMDDAQDASGRGLLDQLTIAVQEASLERLPASGNAARAAPPDPPSASLAPQLDLDSTTAAAPSPLAWWNRLLEADRRPHAPGVWVVYFSLAALPLFGIGGWFVTEPVARARVFGLLVIYVASGLGLLLATSFLGLRRYLRQRQLQMPFEMTSTWIVVGSVMICSMLLVAWLLPRPRAEQSLSQAPFVITAAARKATRIAFGKRGIEDDQNRDAAKTAAKAGQKTSREGNEPGGDRGPAVSGKAEKGQTAAGKDGRQANRGQSEGGNESPGKSPSSVKGEAAGGGQKSENESKPPGNQNGQAKAEDHSSADHPEKSPAGEAPGPADQRMSPQQMVSQAANALAQSVGPLFRWLAMAAVVLVAMGAAWVYREELLAAWKHLLAELWELWNSWFGRHAPAEPTAEELAQVAPPPRTFASFSDPFLSGEAARMTWPQLVRYSFAALEAWARERGCPRGTDQTPHEFGHVLGGTEPALRADLQTLVASYSELAYAQRAAAGRPAETLRQLWFNLRTLAERGPAR